jgi:hypothetical protein
MNPTKQCVFIKTNKTVFFSLKSQQETKYMKTCNLTRTARTPLRQLLESQWAEPVSLTFHSALRKRNTEPFIDASYQISVHLATKFQRRRLFRNRPTRNKTAYGSDVCE